MIVICALLFSKFDLDVGKDFLNVAGRDNVSKARDGHANGPQKVMIDFEYMKSIAALVKRVDDQNRPAPMDLGSFAEVHDHADYVRWNDHGAPDWPESYDDWSPEYAQGQDAHWQEGEAQRLQ